MRLLVNMGIVAVELALIAGIGWLAWQWPLAFTGLTFVLALGLGLRLEQQRLAYELAFYFERVGRLAQGMRLLVGSGEAMLKAILAAALALMTFSGTDQRRLLMLAGVFAMLVLVGSALLRRATMLLGMRPARWGFFRMGAPFGLLVSIAMAFFPAPSTSAIAWRTFFDLPERPTLVKLGETLFQVRLWADDMIVRVLSTWLGDGGARAAGLILSSNVLTGFLVALYAVAVSEIVRVMEEAAWRRG